jgi:hypothetical protein
VKRVSVPLPETIPVKYTEEEAEYLSVRPLVRQTFRLAELVDMVVSVTGKDPGRIQQILRSGTVVYHFYRYWWTGFDVDASQLAALLVVFPDADPGRPFRAEDCTSALLETSGDPPRHSLELARAEAAKKRLLRSRSLWDRLLDLARAHPPKYQDYSYARRADVFTRELTPAEAAALSRDDQKLATSALRVRLRSFPEAARVIFLCARHGHRSEE